VDSRADRLMGRLAALGSVVFIVMLAALVVRFFWTPISRKGPPAYSIGDSLDLPPDTYNASPFTVVVFSRSTCDACQQSKPFHKTLVALTTTNANTRLVLSTPLNAREEAAYAGELGLEPSAVRPWLAGKKPRVHVVPTVVLVNARGDILGSWESLASDAAEHEIVSTITSIVRK
jgi:hypothetical protein